MTRISVRQKECNTCTRISKCGNVNGRGQYTGHCETMSCTLFGQKSVRQKLCDKCAAVKYCCVVDIKGQYTGICGTMTCRLHVEKSFRQKQCDVCPNKVCQCRGCRGVHNIICVTNISKACKKEFENKTCSWFETYISKKEEEKTMKDSQGNEFSVGDVLKSTVYPDVKVKCNIMEFSECGFEWVNKQIKKPNFVKDQTGMNKSKWVKEEKVMRTKEELETQIKKHEKDIELLTRCVTEKWALVWSGMKNDGGCRDCVLCDVYNQPGGGHCDKCPIRLYRGKRLCHGTPYDYWRKLSNNSSEERWVKSSEDKMHAEKMIDFLKKLIEGTKTSIQNAKEELKNLLTVEETGVFTFTVDYTGGKLGSNDRIFLKDRVLEALRGVRLHKGIQMWRYWDCPIEEHAIRVTKGNGSW